MTTERAGTGWPRRVGMVVVALAAMLAATLAGVSAVAVATGGQPATGGWVPVGDGANGPGARWDHTLAADEAGGRLVLFGGRDGAGVPLGDLWLFDPETEAWEAVEASGPAAPSPRFGHAVAVDPDAGAMYLFGGQADGATFFDDAWRLDLGTLTWEEIGAGNGARPSARYGTSAVLDDRGRLLISHGFTFDGRFDDTWALDLASGAWTDVSPPAAGTRPLKRCLHEAVWDAAAERMLLFGGCSSGVGPCPQGDLWAFDPAARTWTELTAAGGPAARSNPALAVGPGGDDAWLFGGLSEAGYAADLWLLPLDAEEPAWAESAVGPAPSPRASHDAAVLGNRLYLFGGIGDGGALADLWALDAGAGSGRGDGAAVGNGALLDG